MTLDRAPQKSEYARTELEAAKGCLRLAREDLSLQQFSGAGAPRPRSRPTRPSIRSISLPTTFEKSSRKSLSENRSGSSSANVLIATRGFLISCAMPDTSAPNDAKRSARRFSFSSALIFERSLKTISAPIIRPCSSRRADVEQTRGVRRSRSLEVRFLLGAVDGHLLGSLVVGSSGMLEELPPGAKLGAPLVMPVNFPPSSCKEPLFQCCRP